MYSNLNGIKGSCKVDDKNEKSPKVKGYADEKTMYEEIVTDNSQYYDSEVSQSLEKIGE